MRSAAKSRAVRRRLCNYMCARSEMSIGGTARPVYAHLLRAPSVQLVERWDEGLAARREKIFDARRHRLVLHAPDEARASSSRRDFVSIMFVIPGSERFKSL